MVLVLIFSLSHSQEVWAEDGSEVATAPEVSNVQVDTSGDDEELEKISITGSRIKKIDLEGASPVLVIDREAMEKTGYNSVGDVLRDMTVNSFGSYRETTNSSVPGAATVSLRGLGSDRTLILIDGKRMQKDAYLNSGDLGLIPFAAVERIEVLKDSASAVYGSDALGGVVNIITRNDFNGTEVSVKQLVSEQVGGDQTEVSVTSGYANSKFNVTGILSYRNNTAIYSRDREHSRIGLSQTGSPGSFRTLRPEKVVGKDGVEKACGEALPFRGWKYSSEITFPASSRLS